jgi:hypothetical protein
MEPVRPLRDVFNDLAADASARPVATTDADTVLRDSGHADLPAGLVAEAVVSYADTAPLEVAEHLAPFVTAHSAVPLDGIDDADADPGHAFDLLATAPAVAEDVGDGSGEEGWLDDVVTAQRDPGATYAEAPDGGADPSYAGAADTFDLAFGAGGRNGADTGGDNADVVEAVRFDPDSAGDGVVPPEPDEPVWTVDPEEPPAGVLPEPEPDSGDENDHHDDPFGAAG